MTRVESAEALLTRLQTVLGPAGVLTGIGMQPFAFDWRDLEESRPDAVLRPQSTAEVAEAVRLCAAAGVPLVPQGGNTGLVGGTVATPGSLLLNLGRMNRIRSLDADGHTVVVDAGVILADLQAAAERAGRLFPLSLGAEGTCTIGGILSTNAGGVLTLRYGNARDLVLGLEVVLADGRVWKGLRLLRKDNTGYDLKHLFLGAEGTLGIITAASLKLYPRPAATETALAAVPDPAAAVALLGRLRAAGGDALTAFELIPRFAIDGGRALLGRDFDPFAEPAPWYVLLEATSGRPGTELRDMLEETLAASLDAGEARDVVIAQNREQQRRFWLLREGLPDIGRRVGGAVHHDISVPVSRVPTLISRGMMALADFMPGIRPYPFGHVGDGNIHFNIARPLGMEEAAFLARTAEITEIIHSITRGLGGSISAEHGIGRRKRHELARSKDPVELALMRAVKGLLDPQDLFNPGKLLPPE